MCRARPTVTQTRPNIGPCFDGGGTTGELDRRPHGLLQPNGLRRFHGLRMPHGLRRSRGLRSAGRCPTRPHVTTICVSPPPAVPQRTSLSGPAQELREVRRLPARRRAHVKHLPAADAGRRRIAGGWRGGHRGEGQGAGEQGGRGVATGSETRRQAASGKHEAGVTGGMPVELAPGRPK